MTRGSSVCKTKKLCLKFPNQIRKLNHFPLWLICVILLGPLLKESTQLSLPDENDGHFNKHYNLELQTRIKYDGSRQELVVGIEQ